MLSDLHKGNGYVHLPASSPIDQPLRPTVFLDRDGVVVEEVGYLGKPEGINILPGVPQALRLLALHFRLVVVTNQSGIAKGMFSEDDLLAVHQRLAMLLADQQAEIEAFFYCPHHPHGAVAAYAEDCQCRKPKPGLLQRASDDLGLSLAGSYMVGDNVTDLQAGRAAGAKGVIVGDNRGDCPDWAMSADNLLEAAGLILADHLEYMNSTPEWRELPCSP